MIVGSEALPREIADGVFWMGGCVPIQSNERIFHAHRSCFLVVGAVRTALIDTSSPREWPELSEQLNSILGKRELDIVFPTHPEPPHAGNLGALLDKYPRAVAMGDLRNYHLFFPDYVHRLRPVTPPFEIDLGDRTLVVMEAVMKDLPNTLWAFDTKARVLFVSDGFSYSHQHAAGECALMLNEMERPPTAEDMGFSLQAAFFWSRFVDPRPGFALLDELLERHSVSVVASSHSNVINDPRAILPLLRRVMLDTAGVG